jgi:hypothetical protein
LPDVRPRLGLALEFFRVGLVNFKLDKSNSKKFSKIVFREGGRNKVIIYKPFFMMFSSSSCDHDNDFFILSFLLLSNQDIIIASALSQASLKHFLPLVEKRRRDCRIP